MIARYLIVHSFLFCCAFLGSTASAQSKPAPDKDVPAVVDIKERVFKSRKEVAKHLGQFIADGIPAAFNFKIHSLVWAGMPVNKSAGVVIKTIPADTAKTTWNYASTMMVEVNRSTTEVLLSLRPDNPCMGGMRKRPEVIRSCSEGLRVSAENAKKLATFFATPRHKLKRVKVNHLPMLKRP